MFWQVRTFEFVNYDDPDYVSANPHVQGGLSWQNIQWAFTTGHASNWHPLTWLSHMLDWQLFGSNPGTQHLVSVFWHAVNTVLLFLILKAVTGAHWRSALVAALFGLHPLRVESVVWVSERKDVLSGFFFLLTIFAYFRYALAREADCGETAVPQAPGHLAMPTPDAGSQKSPAVFTTKYERPWSWYAIALACFALGLMSKPMLVTTPFLLLLLDYWPLGRFRSDQRVLPRITQLIVEKLPFVVLAGVSSVITFLVQRSGGAVSSSLAFPQRIANALVSYMRYLAKTVWPENLSVLYPHPGSWPVWEVAGCGLLLAALSAVALLQIHRRPYLAAGWFWFVGTLVPVIGLIQVGIQSMADRYTYLPCIGLFILGVWALGEVVQARPAAKPAAAVAALFCLLACARISSHQAKFWHDSEALFQRAIDVTPNNYLAYNNLGFYLSSKGRLGQAEENYRKSIAINPLYQDALNNLGYALAGERKYTEAIPYYEAALRVSPNHPEVHNNLGNALSELGRLDEAIEQYKLVLKENPDHADAHNNLGIALAMQGKLDEALEHFRAAIRIKPTYASAHSNLGNAFAAAHRIPEATAEYQECLRLNPDDPQAHNNLGNALMEQGKVDEAIQQYNEALRLKAANPEAHFNLAVALARKNRLPEAAAQFQEVLRLNPGNAEAKRQLDLLSAGK